MKENLGLIPVKNFGHIELGIYRSAQPRSKFEYKWLEEALGIDLIINLRKESQQDLKHSKKVITIPVKDHHPPTVAQAKYFMRIIRNNKAPRILIHCEHGHGRTSTFSVLAKVAMGWDLEKAIADEKKRFHINFNHHMQEEFLRKNFG